MIKDALDTIFGTHDTRVNEWAALRAKHAKAGAARRAEIARAQADVDALEEPRRRLARLQAEAMGAGTREQNEVAALENQLRESAPRELERFTALHQRIVERYRNMDGPFADVEVNRFSDESRVTNLEQLERWQAVGPLLVRISVERRDVLWLLGSGDLRARLTALRSELEAALAGTSLEVELG